MCSIVDESLEEQREWQGVMEKAGEASHKFELHITRTSADHAWTNAPPGQIDAEYQPRLFNLACS